MFHARIVCFLAASLLVVFSQAGSVAAAPFLGLILEPPRVEDTGGARIRFVVPGSPAAEAGLQPGDVVIHVHDQPIGDSRILVETVREMNPGDQVVVTIKRGDGEEQITATLGEEPVGPIRRRPFARRPMIGIQVQFGPAGEVRIADVLPASPAQQAGLLRGDLLTAIDGKQIVDYPMLVDYVHSKQAGDEVNVTITRAGTPHEIKLRLDQYGPS